MYLILKESLVGHRRIMTSVNTRIPLWGLGFLLIAERYT